MRCLISMSCLRALNVCSGILLRNRAAARGMPPADWGEAVGNYDEFRFFTGLRPSEQITLIVMDYDARRAVLSVTKARRPPAG